MTQELKNELGGFKTSKGTIQFTVEKQLPSALVKKIVKARMRENEAREIQRQHKQKRGTK